MRKSVLATGALVMLAVLSPTIRAEEPKAASRAKAFLENKSRATGILFFAHPTAEYSSSNLIATCQVVDRQGKTISGHFVLTYRFYWKSRLFNDNHHTDVDFFFDGNGKFYKIGDSSTTTFINPFTAMDTIVSLAKEALIQAVNQYGTEAEGRLLRILLQNADAKGVLGLLLTIDQRMTN